MKKIGFFFLTLAALAVFCGFVFFHLGTYLEGTAQQPRAADLIVVLGGDAGARSLTGARLYTQGYAPNVLLTGLDDGEKDAVPFYLHWRSQVLMAYGVSESALLFDLVSQNSYQEAQNTAALMAKKGWQKVLVVSDPPHMRRLESVWSQVFAGSGREYRLISARPYWWQAERWWSNEISAKFVVNELIKLGYYQLKY